MRVRGVCAPALELPLAWEGPHPARWRAEPRSEPDSGNPTVRDRRGALRNVTHGGIRNPLRNRKSGTGHSSPKDARAQFLSRHPHAAFEVAGAGNGVTVGSTRARTGKPGIQPRPRSTGHRASPRTYQPRDITLEAELSRDHVALEFARALPEFEHFAVAVETLDGRIRHES